MEYYGYNAGLSISNGMMTSEDPLLPVEGYGRTGQMYLRLCFSLLLFDSGHFIPVSKDLFDFFSAARYIVQQIIRSSFYGFFIAAQGF